MEMKHLFFEVEKVPTLDLIEGAGTPLSNINHAIVGNGKIINFCSENYGLVPNRRIYDEFMAFFKAQGINAKFSGKAFRNSRFELNFTLEDYPREIVKGDRIYPVVRVLNSYDGTQKYQSHVQVMREICSNGLTALVAEKVLKFLHTPQMVGSMGLEATLGSITEFLEVYDDVEETFLELTEYSVDSIENRIEEISEAVSFPKHLMEFAIETAQEEISKFGLPKTDWLVYNAMNFQLNHRSDNLLGRKATRLDRDILHQLINF